MIASGAILPRIEREWCDIVTMQMFGRFLRKTDKETKSSHLSKIFLNACRIAKKIPTYKLKVSLNGRFWEKIEETLIKT